MPCFERLALFLQNVAEILQDHLQWLEMVSCGDTKVLRII